MELETLTTEVKIMALESTVSQLETDIYRCCGEAIRVIGN